jgi:hypothetical protein
MHTEPPLPANRVHPSVLPLSRSFPQLLIPLFPRSPRRLHQVNYQAGMQFCLLGVLPRRVIVALRRWDPPPASGRIRGGEEEN